MKIILLSDPEISHCIDFSVNFSGKTNVYRHFVAENFNLAEMHSAMHQNKEEKRENASDR